MKPAFVAALKTLPSPDGRGPALLVLLAAVAVALGAAMAGARLAAPHGPPVPHAAPAPQASFGRTALDARPVPRTPASCGPGCAEEAPVPATLATLARFAANGLLATLIERDDPLRWTDANLPLLCGDGSRVFVDGAPLVPGALLPAGRMTLRWEMHACDLFGISGEMLSGSWLLDVVRTGDRLRLSARPLDVVLHTRSGTRAVGGVFVGALAV